jgi:hypothetical protein
MLGDLLAKLADETAAIETILSVGDLALLATMRQQAASNGLDLAAFVTQTVQRYAATASDEEWVTLMGALNRSADPAASCLKRVFEHSVT